VLFHFRRNVECGRLCQASFNCTAYHHDKCLKICQLGQKDGLQAALQPGKATVTVFIQPGENILKLIVFFGNLFGA
jgi:hypothetical protein